MTETVGCTSHRDTWKTSYDVLSEKVQKETGLDGHDLLHEIAVRFRPRYILDKQSMGHENGGTEVYEGPEFRINERNEIYYPAYGGVTVNELNENARMYNTHRQYSLEEHTASLLLQKTIVEGASFAATSYKNDMNGQRDVHALVFDKDRGVGKSFIINTAVQNGISDYEGIRERMRSLFPTATEMYPSDGVSVFTDKPLTNEEIQKTTSETHRKEYSRASSISVGVLEDMGLTASFVYQYVGNNVEATYRSVNAFIERKKEKREGQKNVKSEGRKYSDRKIFQFLSEIRDPNIREKMKSIFRKKNVFDAQMFAVRSSILLDVGAGGRLIYLKKIVHDSSIKISKKERMFMKKEMKRLKKRERFRLHLRKQEIQKTRRAESGIPTKKKEVRRRLSLFKNKEFHQRKENKTTVRKIEKVRRKKLDTESQKGEMLFRYFKRFSKKWEHVFLKENRGRRKEKKLTVKRKDVMKGFSPEQSLSDIYEKQGSRRVKESVVKFTQGIILILMLLHSERMNRRMISEKQLYSEKNTECKISEALVKETSWILFSIIWHMNMVREAGVPVFVKIVKKKKKKGKRAASRKKINVRRQSRHMMPVNGIIYAYPTP